MDESDFRSIQKENGFIYRKQTSKSKRIRNELPFSLISNCENFSQNLYGIPALTSLNFDIPVENLKNTKYVSFDYEKYLNRKAKGYSHHHNYNHEYKSNESCSSNSKTRSISVTNNNNKTCENGKLNFNSAFNTQNLIFPFRYNQVFTNIKKFS